MDDSITKLIDDFNHRKIYRSLTPTILAGIADNDFEQAVEDYVFTKFERRDVQKEEVLAQLPKGARALWLTWAVEAEVNNGGFNQYYWNTNDRFAVDAVDAFRFFGAEKHASLMEEANRVRADELGTIQKFKDRGTLEAFSESYKETKLGPLDDRFFSLDENLSGLRIAKIRSAPQLFSEDGLATTASGFEPTPRQRSLWCWFAAGFVLVFAGMLVFGSTIILHSSGQYAARSPLWKFYASATARLFGASAVGPANGDGLAIIRTALLHVLFSAMGGGLTAAVAWRIRRLRSQRHQNRPCT